MKDRLCLYLRRIQESRADTTLFSTHLKPIDDIVFGSTISPKKKKPQICHSSTKQILNKHGGELNYFLGLQVKYNRLRLESSFLKSLVLKKPMYSECSWPHP